MAKISSENLFDASKATAASGPVECLGMTFPTDEARRAHFTELLREKLKEPDFRKIEGFPLGEDEDILALSNPPYYTACPNPFMAEFVRQYGTPVDPVTDVYHREPFAADVSEGKNDPIYIAHSYHTKVPHKAIMRYILHYTEPGQLVYDGFCGTGMTGVAAQLCGDNAAVESLGYTVSSDGVISDKGTPFSKLGIRRAILGDLSPAATFIAYNYNAPANPGEFRVEAERLRTVAEVECGWMYLTLDQPTQTQTAEACRLLVRHRNNLRASAPDLPWGRINYMIWSDVFLCSGCSGEVVFWDAAVDYVSGEVRLEFACPHCGSMLTKRQMDRAFVTVHDLALNKPFRQSKQVPVLINYSVGTRRCEKIPDIFDIAMAGVINAEPMRNWHPQDRMPDGDESRRNDDAGITHVHHFYTRRSLQTVAKLFDSASNSAIKCAVQGGYTVGLKTARFLPKRWRDRDTGPVKPHTAGTLYVPSLNAEQNWIKIFVSRCESTEKAMRASKGVANNTMLSTVSGATTRLPDGCLDYIFTDPPFGGNLMYSELNFLCESWFRVRTDNRPEAIENTTQSKGLNEYQEIMSSCFAECYRVLKPGRWMTVEFHNSKNRVWAAIQEGISHAGFVVCDVRTLDKQQGSFKQYNSANAVKQDLVISAYKPAAAVEERFKLAAGTESGAWEFVRSHLRQVPVFVAKDGRAEVLAERQKYLLFDRMIGFHVQRGYSVPLSAADFYAGLRERLPERDGMYFLADQTAEYDRHRADVAELEQLSLFVSDERSAIRWVRAALDESPQTFGELQPVFMREAQNAWEKHETPPDLKVILEQSFVTEPDGRWHVPDPKNETHLEQLRQRALLREFHLHLGGRGKLRQVRAEAMGPASPNCGVQRTTKPSSRWRNGCQIL